MAVTSDFYTYRKDIRPFGGGSPVSYLPDSTLLVANGGTPLYQGEMLALKFVGNVRTVVRFVTDGSAGNFIGVSRDSQQGVAKLGNQAALIQAVNLDFSVFTTGVHQFKTTVGQTYAHGMAVYMGADTATVTLTGTSGQPVIGMVFLESTDGTPVVGAAGVRVNVLIDNHTLNQVGSVS